MANALNAHSFHSENFVLLFGADAMNFLFMESLLHRDALEIRYENQVYFLFLSWTTLWNEKLENQNPQDEVVFPMDKTNIVVQRKQLDTYVA